MKLKLFLSMILIAVAFFGFAAETVVTTGASATDTNVIAEPGPLFTNSVKMELVKLPVGIWAGKFEVTQKEYQEVMGQNPSDFQGEKNPANNVSWNDAMAFCEKLTALDIKKRSIKESYHYALPNEDEWAALVGDASLTNAITSLDANRRTACAQVGSIGTNSLGLCDVRGNVMEFVWSDPGQPFRFLKGGSWQDYTDANLRPEFRWYCKPDDRQNTFGFRCLLRPK